jgi:hypothetical protein
MMDREPVGQALNSIISELSDTAWLALDPLTYDEVAAEEGTIWYIKNQCEWILSYIKETEEDKIKAMK